MDLAGIQKLYLPDGRELAKLYDNQGKLIWQATLPILWEGSSLLTGKEQPQVRVVYEKRLPTDYAGVILYFISDRSLVGGYSGDSFPNLSPTVKIEGQFTDKGLALKYPAQWFGKKIYFTFIFSDGSASTGFSGNTESLTHIQMYWNTAIGMRLVQITAY